MEALVGENRQHAGKECSWHATLLGCPCPPSPCGSLTYRQIGAGVPKAPAHALEAALLTLVPRAPHVLGSNVQHQLEQEQLGKARDQLPARHRHVCDAQRATVAWTPTAAAAAAAAAATAASDAG